MTPKVFLRAAARPSFFSRVINFAIAACAITVILATSAAGASLRMIYKMNASTSDAPLMRDAAGNLYGTTEDGGNTACSGGCGTVFELSPTSVGGWRFTVLHKFTGGVDGELIYGGLALDASGISTGPLFVGASMVSVMYSSFLPSPVEGGSFPCSILSKIQTTEQIPARA
ncbi:MAG: choice-of-anchor tandem repeat GloVer-containing protein [Candidatus Sulfotelmatobacter sp.]